MARAARTDDFDMAMLDWWFVAPPSVVRLPPRHARGMHTPHVHRMRTACALHAHCMRTA
tara:strand:- start:261 stop:437 length:177 start_codon:yes stop_codon:yes gene_type:complete